MQRHYFDKLGVEHSRWLPLAGDLLCGFSADTSCRDLARFGLLWANEGLWPGVDGEPEQLMGREYSIEGRSWVFPNSGRDYGYTLPLSSNDPVGKRSRLLFTSSSSAQEAQKKLRAQTTPRARWSA